MNLPFLGSLYFKLCILLAVLAASEASAGKEAPRGGIKTAAGALVIHQLPLSIAEPAAAAFVGQQQSLSDTESAFAASSRQQLLLSDIEIAFTESSAQDESHTYTGPEASEIRTPGIDSTKIENRTPPAGKFSEYANDRAFTYEETPRETESLLDRIKYWIREKIFEFFRQPAAKSLIEIAFYIGFAAFILMLLNQFMKGNLGSLFISRNMMMPGNFSINQSDGSGPDLDRLIREAVDKNQFGLAVRYLYQRSLTQLENSGYISWKKNKTNSDYLYEIKGNELRDLFREVTRYYDYAEYGNFAVSRADFDKVRHRFDQMETLIKTNN